MPTKFGCLLYEMFFNKELKASLNTQEDSIQAELFTWLRLQGKQHNFRLHSHYIFDFIKHIPWYKYLNPMWNFNQKSRVYNFTIKHSDKILITVRKKVTHSLSKASNAKDNRWALWIMVLIKHDLHRFSTIYVVYQHDGYSTRNATFTQYSRGLHSS